jgi:hypothetical protein
MYRTCVLGLYQRESDSFIVLVAFASSVADFCCTDEFLYWTALSLYWAGANLQVRSEPVTAVSSKGEHIVVVIFPRIGVREPCLVTTRIRKLGSRRKGSMRSQRVGRRIAGICSHVPRKTPSSIGYKCTAIVALTLASVKVKFIGLVATVKCVFCVILVEDKRSNLSALLTITVVLGTRPDLAVQRATTRVLNVPSPSRFVRVVGNNVVSRVKVAVHEAFGIARAEDISVLARRWRYGRLTGRPSGGTLRRGFGWSSRCWSHTEFHRR